MSPKVSVIVTSYNQGRFLRRAVDSVLHQTFCDFEVIVVDDGSQDDSIEIIQELLARHPGKLRFYYHPNHQNLGVRETYVLAISQAESPYLAFLEGDDFWARDFLERKVDLLNHCPEVGVVFSPYKIVSEGYYGFDMVVRQWLLGLFMLGNLPFDNLKNLMRKNNVATFSAFMTRKSLLDQISFTLPPGALFLDWWILFQLGMLSKFYVDKTSCVYWRHHGASALGIQRLAQHKTMLCQFMQMMYEEIGRNMDCMNERNRTRYLKNRFLLPKFVSFYQQPDIKRFLAFFCFSPMWAVESLASYCINSWKHSR